MDAYVITQKDSDRTVGTLLSFFPEVVPAHFDLSRLLRLAPWKKSYDQPRQHIKKQRHYFANKGPNSQSYGFSSSHVLMWKLGHKESWALKNGCFWTVMLENTLESLLDCKEIKPVTLKEINPEYSLEGDAGMLKLQYFGHLMRRASSLEETLKLEKNGAKGEGGIREWDG